MNVTDQIAYGIVVGGVSLMILRGSLTVGSFAAYLSAAERFRHSVSLMGYDLMTLDADLRYLADLIDYLELSDEQLLARLHKARSSRQTFSQRCQVPRHLRSSSSVCHSPTLVLRRWC